MVGAVVTIDRFQRLDRHAEEARRLPDRHAPLHHPSRPRVAQCVQRHLVRSVKFQPSRLDHFAPDGARVVNRPPVIVANGQRVTVILAAASADERRAVSDSPLLPRLVEVEPRRGSPSWHSRTISFIARGVV